MNYQELCITQYFSIILYATYKPITTLAPLFLMYHALYLRHTNSQEMVLSLRVCMTACQKLKCLSIHVPPAFPQCTVLFPKSPSFMMLSNRWTDSHTHTDETDSITSTADAGGNYPHAYALAISIVIC